jgi:hypothetical protein
VRTKAAPSRKLTKRITMGSDWGCDNMGFSSGVGWVLNVAQKEQIFS